MFGNFRKQILLKDLHHPVLLFNPYHDRLGRFAGKGGGAAIGAVVGGIASGPAGAIAGAIEGRRPGTLKKIVKSESTRNVVEGGAIGLGGAAILGGVGTTLHGKKAGAFAGPLVTFTGLLGMGVNAREAYKQHGQLREYKAGGGKDAVTLRNFKDDITLAEMGFGGAWGLAVGGVIHTAIGAVAAKKYLDGFDFEPSEQDILRNLGKAGINLSECDLADTAFKEAEKRLLQNLAATHQALSDFIKSGRKTLRFPIGEQMLDLTPKIVRMFIDVIERLDSGRSMVEGATFNDAKERYVKTGKW